ncbi:MAG: cytochrome ubiquinol oxidase subunit I [Candidatus Korobacteraceae bacterium]
MDSAVLIHRLHFAFTVTFHYLFPQLTMGLAPLVVALESIGLWKDNEKYRQAARFWAKIFGISFVFGVVTGIPMEFQFGTNWSHFSRFAGGVIGQTLAMEGTFAFFMESAFLGLFLFGEKRLSKIAHWWTGVGVFLGSWLSGYFIVATDAWMQHPVAYRATQDGSLTLSSFWGLLLNPWALWQYAHNMAGAAVTGAFAMAALGAYYLLSEVHKEYGKIFVRVGVVSGILFSLLVIGPTGDGQGRNLANYQPAALAAMEAHFDTKTADLVILGQPNVEDKTIDNPLVVPHLLSFLVNRDWKAQVRGLSAFPESEWPTNIALLYYAYHIMVGLGTIFMAVMLICGIQLLRKKLFETRWLLWILMLSAPLPFIANTAGWMTAELGRQPYLIYGILRTIDGYSKSVSAANVWFTLLGFMGMYTLIAILFLFLVQREVAHGPDHLEGATPAPAMGGNAFAGGRN